MHFIRMAALAVLLLPAIACTSEKQEKFKLIHTADLATLLAQHPGSVHVFDANEPEFRAKNGIIPGAKLLSSFDKYEIAKELPADKSATLVFYCSSRL